MCLDIGKNTKKNRASVAIMKNSIESVWHDTPTAIKDLEDKQYSRHYSNKSHLLEFPEVPCHPHTRITIRPCTGGPSFGAGSGSSLVNSWHCFSMVFIHMSVFMLQVSRHPCGFKPWLPGMFTASELWPWQSPDGLHHPAWGAAETAWNRTVRCFPTCPSPWPFMVKIHLAVPV